MPQGLGRHSSATRNPGRKTQGRVTERPFPFNWADSNLKAWSTERLAWPFGPERFTTAPMAIGGCSPSILKPIGCSSGMSRIFEVGAFLIAAGSGPEKQELLPLIGTLVRAPDATKS